MLELSRPGWVETMTRKVRGAGRLPGGRTRRSRVWVLEWQEDRKGRRKHYQIKGFVDFVARSLGPDVVSQPEVCCLRYGGVEKMQVVSA